MLAGTYEMGKGSLLASLLAHLRGLPIKIIANGVLWDEKKPITLMVVAADSTIKGAPDLNGKTAAQTGLNDITHLAMIVWVDTHGGDSKTMKFLEIPQSAAAAALIEHRIDVYNLNEPLLTAALETGKVRVLAAPYNALGDHFAGTVYFVHADWAAKHQDAIRKWVRVTYDAATYTNSHNAETAPMMAEVTKLPLATIQKIRRADGATSSDPRLIQTVIDIAAKYQFLPRVFRPATFTSKAGEHQAPVESLRMVTRARLCAPLRRRASRLDAMHRPGCNGYHLPVRRWAASRP